MIFLWLLMWGSEVLGTKSADASKKYPESTQCDKVAESFYIN